jgi:hypothetical protein
MVDLVAAAAGVLVCVSYILDYNRHGLNVRAGIRERGELRVCLRDGVGSSGGGLPARSAVPDANSGALDGVLSAELAHVAGVLCDLSIVVSYRSRLRGGSFGRAHLHLLDLLSKRSTVTGTVLSGDADLLCACFAINNGPISEGK